MGNPSLTRVVINGVTVDDYVITWTLGEVLETAIRTATVVVKYDMSNVLPYEEFLLIGKTIEIYRGVSSPTERKVFKGYVRKCEENSGKVSIQCEDMLSVAMYTTLNRSFDINVDTEAGVISEIFKTCINSYTNLIADSTSVQNSGTVNVLGKFRFRQRVLIDGLIELATALNWVFYYDVTLDRVRFEPKGFRTSTTVLTVGDNVVQVPKWEFPSNEMFNKVTVVGQPQSILKTAGPYKLDGTTANWGTVSILLPDKPDSVQLFADTTATPTTERRLGVDGSTPSASYDYSVDKFTNKITWNTATYAPGTTTYVKVVYTTQQSISVTRKNQSSIDTYSGGVPKQITLIREDLQTVDDCAQLASSQLAIYGTPFVQITSLKVRSEEALDVGVLYQVVDNIQGYTYTLLCKSVTMTYPYVYDVLSVADKEYRLANWDANIGQRLRKVEEQQVEGSQLISEYTDIEVENDLGPRQHELYKRNTSADYKLGLNFTLGTARLQGTYTNAPTLAYRFPGNAYYEEYVRDNYYYDSTDNMVLRLDTAVQPSPTVTDLSAAGNNGTFKINATAYYPFNGNANDASINGNNGTVTGATLTSDRFGSANNAYLFNGTSNYITLPASNVLMTSTSAWTIFAVFTPDPTDTDGRIVNLHQGATATSAANIQINSAINFMCQYRDSLGTVKNINLGVPGGGSFTAQPYIIIYSYNGTQYRAKAYTLTTNGNAVTATDTFNTWGSFPAYIGSFNGAANLYKGVVDEVGLISGLSLSETEMDNLANVLRSHKLDKPLVTKTDSLGQSITGYELDGVSNYVEFGDVFNVTGDRSIYFEYMPASLTAGQYILSKYNGSSTGHFDVFTASGSKIGITYRSSTVNNTLNSNTVFVTGRKYKIYHSFNKTTGLVELYVDGSFDSSNTQATNILTNSQNFVIGARANTLAQKNAMVISKPIIFNRVLSTAERTALFSGYIPQSNRVTWDTSAKTITILDKGVVLSKPVVYNAIVKSVNVQMGATTGNYAFYVSGDGKSTWQRITSFGVKVPIVATSGTLYYRIESVSGTVTVQNTYKAGNEIDYGAVNILVEV